MGSVEQGPSSQSTGCCWHIRTTTAFIQRGCSVSSPGRQFSSWFIDCSPFLLLYLPFFNLSVPSSFSFSLRHISVLSYLFFLHWAALSSRGVQTWLRSEHLNTVHSAHSQLVRWNVWQIVYVLNPSLSPLHLSMFGSPDELELFACLQGTSAIYSTFLNRLNHLDNGSYVGLFFGCKYASLRSIISDYQSCICVFIC